MTILHVVSDSNFYRGASDADLGAAIEMEQLHGIVPLASFWPPIELLSHCVAPEDPGYRGSLRAVQRLRRHTGYVAEGSFRTRVIEDGESQVVRGMFGGTFTNRRLDTDNLTQVIAEATLAGEWSPEIRDALTALVSKVALRERAFADAMSSLSVGISSAVEQGHAKDLKEARQAFLAALSSPNALVLASEVIAAQSASMAGLSVPEGLVRARAPMLLESFATTVHFMIRLLRKGLESEVNWHGKPHCNSAWDLLISFHVTSRVKVNSLPVLLVSDDGDIRSAAVAAGWGEFVVPRNRYFDLLSTGGIVAYAGVLQARAA